MRQRAASTIGGSKTVPTPWRRSRRPRASSATDTFMALPPTLASMQLSGWTRTCAAIWLPATRKTKRIVRGTRNCERKLVPLIRCTSLRRNSMRGNSPRGMTLGRSPPSAPRPIGWHRQRVVQVSSGASATSLGEGNKGHTPDPPQQNPSALKPPCHHRLAELPPSTISSTHVWYAMASHQGKQRRQGKRL